MPSFLDQGGIAQSTLRQVVNAFRMAVQFELIKTRSVLEQLGCGCEFFPQVGDALAKGEMLGKLHQANQIPASATTVAVEQILARVDIEGGMDFLMQRTESDELGARAGAVSDPVVPLQVLEQWNARFELFQILAHGGRHSPSPNYKLQAPVSRQGWWVSKKISLLSVTQWPEDLEKRKQGPPGQAQGTALDGLAAGQSLPHNFQGRAQKGKRRSRRIQVAEPAAQSGRVRDSIRIFEVRHRTFPRTTVKKVSSQRLTARDQTVMGVGEGENGEERDSQFAKLAETTAIPDPVVTVVMCLFAAPAVTDDDRTHHT